MAQPIRRSSGATSEVFAVLAGIAAWSCWNSVADLAEQWEGFLVRAHDRTVGSYVRAQPARTSSMQVANSAFARGGMFQHFLR
ncbi:hypothetical protein [Kibdelosporangium phytohabitans]|uniref:Uncharacterized protein n=1 Tax=Kibdelosporangium phytohabitans TaxID=860235 RepID=A0A0N9I0F4_9PSEU|nr:hypothetical protein [Kibdelosporangium phytohabitans]ALG13171.1 hypothetical protein AOZ06_45585 [Kibdelosporangium phytohabitans]MBE1464929.1 hypothetical protein [Kibdelosporangium phytohabitans]